VTARAGRSGLRFRSSGNAGGGEVHLGVGIVGEAGNRVETGSTRIDPESHDTSLTREPDGPFSTGHELSEVEVTVGWKLAP
jgi:hypothetical protein